MCLLSQLYLVIIPVPAIAKVREIKSTAEYEHIMRNPSTKVLMFYAPWCPFCKKAQPIIDSLSMKHDCKFYAINVDKLASVSQDVDALPTIRVVRKRKVQDSMSGVDKSDMKRIIRKYCGKR